MTPPPAPTRRLFPLPRIGCAGILITLLAISPLQAQLMTGDSNVGYIDSSILATQMRVRFDAGFSSVFSDRVEFVYAKYGQPGAPQAETEIDSHHELSTYLEYKPLRNVSLFVDIPVRWINPIVNDNTGGLYDMTAGAKFSLLETTTSQWTAQLRTYIPTGDTDSGLSTGHVSLEPSLLMAKRLSDRLTLEGELRDWIPIGASTTGPGSGGGGGGGGGGGSGQGGRRDFGGNVLRYGIGLGYRGCDTDTVSLTPVAELVGWHVFSGLKSTVDGQRVPATNDHITNLKLGVRFGFNPCHRNDRMHDTLYVGYGTSLSDDYWYRELLRIEYRKRF